MPKYVYFFGEGKAEGKGTLRDLLGGKGAGLAEMTNAGVPVPPGFTITTEVCRLFYKNKKRVPGSVKKQIDKHLHRLEKAMGSRLGDPEHPLLVSVRSGAKFSMPGMMDTILNLGLNDKTVEGLIRKTKDERFSLDCYRRFIQMFGNVVLGVEKSVFEEVLQGKKKERGIVQDIELTASDLRDLVARFKDTLRHHAKADLPQDNYRQLEMARDAVFLSWNNDRAIFYRRQYNIPESLGTAVNVQAMVFGNMGPTSGTGVGFTRNPSTGEKEFFGEYLTHAQGEDVVAGVRTPKPIRQLKGEMPLVYQELVRITQRLERHYRDVQDFEFTIQQGKLYMLQTRSGKRTGPAAVKIAVDMVQEKLIKPEEAILRVEPDQLHQLLHPRIDARANVKVIAKGLNASPGAAVGKVIFNATEAAEAGKRGERVVLVRQETSPDDIHGIAAAQGILTATGGATSHAVVVSRQMGKPCVAGCSAISIDEERGQFLANGVIVKKGDMIAIDGSTGQVMLGDVPTIQPDIQELEKGEYGKLMRWADQFRRLGVRANADIPRDAIAARHNGAEGIGLCRTEHMFFAKDRLPIMQEMILAQTPEDRKAALDKLAPMQKEDFKGLFRAMGGYPVTIRLLDPPLHEFLPKQGELIAEIQELRFSQGDRSVLHQKEILLDRVEQLHEFNPMLGLRGCRLGITMPEITRMQARSILEAACELSREKIRVYPEIMIPLVGTVEEFRHQKQIVLEVAETVFKAQGVRVQFLVGTMIEIPRAALTADEIAKEADFFSFGTNDLTQMTFGFSRDDTGKFLPKYLAEGILDFDPFVTIDQEGMGQLIRMGTEKGRQSRPDLKVGICGEHGGEPLSVGFCHTLRLNYVSCSPYRVPIARLAAAQAALREELKTKDRRPKTRRRRSKSSKS
ncbi:MAG: pyruvate, phosphate dikinase [Candidatus Omnitrophica bacterium]|nr:pyruvate, phosphate dikinase [Candidatus Omnitrophota bacterium]